MPGRNQRPQRTGPFKADAERLAQAEFHGDLITVRNVRDCDFPAFGERHVRWIDETFDPREITNLWVFFGYFGAFQGIAHTEIAFEFSDDRCVTVSFEIRPLAEQRYTIKEGLRKNYELALRWTTERDALLRRVWREDVDTKMYMFEAAITHTRTIELFRGAAERTNELYDNPEWYNAASNSCAINLVKLVNAVLPGQLKSTPRVVLPGLLPKYWAKRGVLKLDGSFEQTLARSMINDRAAEIGYVDDFSPRFHGRVSQRRQRGE